MAKAHAKTSEQLRAIDNGPPGTPDYSAFPNIKDWSHMATSAHDFARNLEGNIKVNYFTNRPTLDEVAFRLIAERDECMRRQGDRRTVAALLNSQQESNG